VNLGFIYEAFFAIKAEIRDRGRPCRRRSDYRASQEKIRLSSPVPRSGCYALTTPDFAEELAIAALVWCRETGARAFACHVSSRKGLEAGKRAKTQKRRTLFMECAALHHDVHRRRVPAEREENGSIYDGAATIIGTARDMRAPSVRTFADALIHWDGL